MIFRGRGWGGVSATYVLLRHRVELEYCRCLFNSSQHWTDYNIIGGFLPHLAIPRFSYPTVGGFINNILRGLLRINYELYTYYAGLHSTVLFEGISLWPKTTGWCCARDFTKMRENLFKNAFTETGIGLKA